MIDQDEIVRTLKQHILDREIVIRQQVDEIRQRDAEIARLSDIPDIVEDVRAFHAGTGAFDPAMPTRIDTRTRDLRWALIDEEVNKELFPAMLTGDLVGIADGIADAIYVLIGTALAYGIPFYAVWREVQRSNMSKFVDGKAVFREDGKVQKGVAFSPADVRSVIWGAVLP